MTTLTRMLGICGRLLFVMASMVPFPGQASEDVTPLHEQIDALIARGWAERKVAPSSTSQDAEFVRRIFLDLKGVIPTANEALTFLDNTHPKKRVRLIDELLASPEYALNMARVFDVMLTERRLPAVKSYDVPSAAWRTYLAESFAANKPWDQLVREILASDGSDGPQAAAVKFYVVRDAEPHQLTRDVGRLFLGTDLQCAQCHDDPRFDDYTQADYYGIHAFFNRVSFFRDAKLNRSFVDEKAAGEATFTSVFTAKQGKTDPRLPGGPMIPDPAIEKGKEYIASPGSASRGIPKYSRRLQLAEHMPSAGTKGFSRNLANRVWALLMGRGLVHPLDLHHQANPPSHPELLGCIEKWVVDHHYDIRGCMREIALSRAYQISGDLLPGTAAPAADAFAVAPLRGLTPEQLRWSLMQATGRIEAHIAREEAKLKSSKPDEEEARRKDWRWKKDIYDQLERQSNPVITTFSRLPGQGDDEFEPVVDHALFLLNSPKLIDLTKAAPGTVFDCWARLNDPAALAQAVYLAVFSRRPAPDEVTEMTEIVGKSTTPVQRVDALQPFVWGLLLSAEFRLTH